MLRISSHSYSEAPFWRILLEFPTWFLFRVKAGGLFSPSKISVSSYVGFVKNFFQWKTFSNCEGLKNGAHKKGDFGRRGTPGADFRPNFRDAHRAAAAQPITRGLTFFSEVPLQSILRPKSHHRPLWCFMEKPENSIKVHLLGIIRIDEFFSQFSKKLAFIFFNFRRNELNNAKIRKKA